MNEDKKPHIPKWLDDLQQRSWEPEILLSGIVLYGMFKVPGLLEEFLAFFKLNVFNSQDIDNLVALFKMGIYWLISGLIMHLICRGIWIGMVGLSYAFPKGIRMDRISYQGKFAEKVMKIPGFEEIVIMLEKVSSSLFSVSFMLFMSLIGGYLFFLVVLIIPFLVAWQYFEMDFEGPAFEAFQIWVYIVAAVGILGLIDFVSLGYFRRFRWVARVYWPLHRVISFLTLSRFYRPIYYGMVTNFNRWAMFILLVVFTFVSIMGSGSITNTTYPGDVYSRLSFWNTTRGYSSFVGYYDDQNSDNPSVQAHIQSDVINDDVLRLFVVANISYEDEMEEYTSLDSLQKVYPDTLRAALDHMIVHRFYQVQIDGVPVKIERWFSHYKSHLKQRGYLTYINIADLDEGLHELVVEGPDPDFSWNLARIPFYRDIVDRRSREEVRQETEESVEDFQPKPFGIRK